MASFHDDWVAAAFRKAWSEHASGTGAHQQHFHDALLYGMSFHGHDYRDVVRTPPLHGAVDYHQHPDGTWRAEPITFGWDMAVGPDLHVSRNWGSR